jgi:hypothetical protein
LPEFVVVDREGVVRGVFVGEKSLSTVEGAIKNTLEAK